MKSVLMISLFQLNTFLSVSKILCHIVLFIFVFFVSRPSRESEPIAESRSADHLIVKRHPEV